MAAWRNNKNIEDLLRIVSEEKDFIVFDLETTGLSRKNDTVIQFSGIKYSVNKGVITEKEVVDTYINPERPIKEKITEITGINDETVADAPVMAEAIEKIIKPFFGSEPILVGYNSRTFDILMMKAVYERFGEEFNVSDDIDVMYLARDFLVNDIIPDKKLGTVAHYCGVDAGITFHNSLDDVRATARLLMYFYAKAKEKAEKDEKEKSRFKIAPRNINKVVYWAGYRGHSRAYVQTNIGEFYYDSYKKEWGLGKSNIYSIDEVDMEALQKAMWTKYNVDSDEDMFVKIKKECA